MDRLCQRCVYPFADCFSAGFEHGCRYLGNVDQFCIRDQFGSSKRCFVQAGLRRKNDCFDRQVCQSNLGGVGKCGGESEMISLGSAELLRK